MFFLSSLQKIAGFLILIILLPVAPFAIAAVGGGGESTTTTTTSTTRHDTHTPVELPLEELDTYLTVLTGRIGSGADLITLNFDKAFLDLEVQNAIGQIKTALSLAASPDLLDFSSPNLLSSFEELLNSQNAFLGNQLNHTETSVTTQTTFGPATILIGEDQSQTFFVGAGTLNVNTNTHTESFLDDLFQQTDTYRLNEHYEIVGNLLAAQAVVIPEPGSLLLTGLGLLGIAASKRRKTHF